MPQLSKKKNLKTVMFIPRFFFLYCRWYIDNTRRHKEITFFYHVITVYHLCRILQLLSVRATEFWSTFERTCEHIFYNVSVCRLRTFPPRLPLHLRMAFTLDFEQEGIFSLVPIGFSISLQSGNPNSFTIWHGSQCLRAALLHALGTHTFPQLSRELECLQRLQPS